METNENKSNKDELWAWVDKCLIDNTITDKERDFLMKKATALGIDVDEFSIELDAELYKRTQNLNSIQAETLQEPVRTKPIRQQKKPNKKRGVLSFICIAVIIGCIYAILSVAGTIKAEEKPVPFDKFVRENPELIFKTATFNKFLVKGTEDNVDKHLFKLIAYQVQATANYFIELNNISMDNRTNQHSRKLYLNYSSKTFFPVAVDVDINQKDIVEVNNISPEPVSEIEAEMIAKPVSIIAGGLSALVGAKFGGAIGGAFGMYGKPIGALLGVGAGAAVGYKTFVATKNYFWGKELASSYHLSDEEEFIFASKQLMAVEMLNMNLESDDDLQKLQKQYEKEIQDRLSSVMKRFGWNQVYVNFVYNIPNSQL